MLAIQHKGPGPLTFLVLCLCAAPAAMAQIAPPALMGTQVMGDTGEFSGFTRPAAQPAGNGPLDEAPFTVLRHGGPWSAADTPVVPTGTRAAMALARQGRWPALAERLEKDQTHPDVRDQDGATLLTLAARAGELAVVQDLLRRGADPDRRGVAGFTPLAAAATGGHDLVVLELLRADADPDIASANGQTPLHLAARAGHPRVVRQLLKAHADPMAWNRDGRHVLSEAALGGQVAVMDMLVASGLDAGTRDRHGLNALHAAALGRQSVAAAWLRQHGVQVTHPLTQVLIDKPEDTPVAMP